MSWSREEVSGRGDTIRTCDLFHPMEARYQTAPRPATGKGLYPRGLGVNGDGLARSAEFIRLGNSRGQRNSAPGPVTTGRASLKESLASCISRVDFLEFLHRSSGGEGKRGDEQRERAPALFIRPGGSRKLRKACDMVWSVGGFQGFSFFLGEPERDSGDRVLQVTRLGGPNDRGRYARFGE